MGDKKKRYGPEEKLRALQVLDDADGDFQLASTQSGISDATLRRWDKQRNESPKRTFQLLLQRHIHAHANLFAHFTGHPTLIGVGREGSFADYLAALLPRKFEVLTGTLATPATTAAARCQVDVMVANTLEFPVPIRRGPMAVVLPESVEATVEVKSGLSSDDFASAFQQIRSVHRHMDIGKPPFSALFSYSGPATPETLKRYLESFVDAVVNPAAPAPTPDGHEPEPLPTDWRADDLPDVIAADSGALGLLQHTQGKPSYAVVGCDVAEAISYVIYRILNTLYHPSEATLSDAEAERLDLREARRAGAAWDNIREYFDVDLDFSDQLLIPLSPLFNATPEKAS